MFPPLWIGKTGLEAQQTNLSVLANNMANVNTTGFKRVRTEFQDLLYQTIRAPGTASSLSSEYPVGLQLGLGLGTGTRQFELQFPQLGLGDLGRGFLFALQPNLLGGE